MPKQQSGGGITPWDPIDDLRRNVNIALWVSFILAAPIQVFLRQRFGSRYFGYHLMLGWVFLFLVPALMPQADPAPLRWFLLASVLAYLVMIDRRRQQVKRGAWIHSGYSGDPFIRHPHARTVIEPLVVFTIGCIVHEWAPALGAYLCCGSVGSALFHMAVERRENTERRAVRDALIDANVQQAVMEEERAKLGM